MRCIDACAPEENEENLGGQQDEDQSMAWKQLRPSAFFTVGKAMYIGALISLITSTVVGFLFMSVIYLSYKTELSCQFHSRESIPVQVQWISSISGILSCAFLYMWFFVCVVLLFRPFQLIGVKRKLVLATFLLYSLDTFYRVALQVLQIKDPSLSFVSYEHMRASLSFNEAFFEWTLEKTTGNIFLSNYSTDLF